MKHPLQDQRKPTSVYIFHITAMKFVYIIQIPLILQILQTFIKAILTMMMLPSFTGQLWIFRTGLSSGGSILHQEYIPPIRRPVTCNRTRTSDSGALNQSGTIQQEFSHDPIREPVTCTCINVSPSMTWQVSAGLLGKTNCNTCRCVPQKIQTMP